ncbi:hypothetical protein D3C80_1221000 [compost metagenome]
MFTVVPEVLLFAVPGPLLDQVTPWVIAVFLIAPMGDPVVLELGKFPCVEIQPVGRRVVTELFTAHQRAGITAAQLAIGFVLVLDLTT